VGRGVLRNPWIFAQADALASGRPLPDVSKEDRGRFLLEYIELLLNERVDEPTGFRHSATDGTIGSASPDAAGAGENGGSHGGVAVGLSAVAPARGRERWVINKLRALCAWYTRGFEGGSHLRVAVNQTTSIPALRQTITEFFF
jgi:tRNA-dihydrouridine synthase